jgi:hypothetical protein
MSRWLVWRPAGEHVPEPPPFRSSANSGNNGAKNLTILSIHAFHNSLIAIFAGLAIEQCTVQNASITISLLLFQTHGAYARIELALDKKKQPEGCF